MAQTQQELQGLTGNTSQSSSEEGSPNTSLDVKNKISPRKKLVQKAKEELEQQHQGEEENNVSIEDGELEDVVDDTSLPVQNNWRTAYVNEVLFPNGTPQDVHVYIKYHTRTNQDPLRCNTVRFVDLRQQDGTVNSIYSSLKYEIHQEVTIRYYNLCDETKRMSFPPCLSMRIQVMSADTHEELKKSDTYLKGKIECTLIPTEERKNADETRREVTYTSTQKIQFAKGARDQKAYFQISYFDARDVTASIPILTLSSPQFSVWSRHTRNSSKKPGRPKKEQGVATANVKDSTLPALSSTFPTQVNYKRRSEEQISKVVKKRKEVQEEDDSKEENSAILEQGVVMMGNNNPLLQYTSQFYQILTILADKEKMGTEERRAAFKLAYQHLCSQSQQ